MLGPTGTGVLYAKADVLKEMKPVTFGGGMVDTVLADHTTFAEPPECFEAGTPDYPGAIALGAAIEYLNGCTIESIAEREDILVRQLEGALRQIEGVIILGGNGRKSGALSIVVAGLHPYDLGSVLDKHGIAVRAGNLCAQPLIRKLGHESVLRFSPAFYNTSEEVRFVKDSLEETIRLLRRWKAAK
jgi:cysteine desulfurase/selenocysteine lyase